MVEVSGPVVSWPENIIANSQDIVSFRLLAAYHLPTDAIVMRLDIKSGDKQHGRGLSVQLSEPKPGERITSSDALTEPKSGVLRATSVLVDREELISALRDLADKLEALK